MKGFVKLLRILAGIAVTAGIIFLIVFFVRHSKPVIYDLRAYLDHSLSGYDGEAVMDVSVNKNGLAEDILPQLKKKDHDAYQALTEAIKSGQSSTFIDTLFDMTVSDTAALSNGDTVTVKFSYDNEALAHYGIAFTGDTDVIQVENLKEIQKIDLFADLQPDFAGISPYLTTDDRIFYETGDAYVVCTVSPSDHLKAGDQITVTMDPEESELPEGTRPAETSKKITVRPTDAFVMSPAEFTDKDLDRIRSQCEKMLQGNEAFSGLSVVPEQEEEAEFVPDEAGLQISNLQFTKETAFFADDGTLDCTEVISQETPDLMAVYYSCDIVEAEQPSASEETVEQEDVKQSELQQNEAEADKPDTGGKTSGGSDQNDQDPAEDSAEDETAEPAEQTVLYHVYGTVFVGHIVRTTEDHLTFRIMNQPQYTAALHLYENQDMLAEAVNQCAEGLPGNLRAVQ